MSASAATKYIVDSTTGGHLNPDGTSTVTLTDARSARDAKGIAQSSLQRSRCPEAPAEFVQLGDHRPHLSQQSPRHLARALAGQASLDSGETAHRPRIELEADPRSLGLRGRDQATAGCVEVAHLPLGGRVETRIHESQLGRLRDSGREQGVRLRSRIADEHTDLHTACHEGNGDPARPRDRRLQRQTGLVDVVVAVADPISDDEGRIAQDLSQPAA